MRIAEALLLALSRSPECDDYERKSEATVPGQELIVLRREFPHFLNLVRGKRVVDFGCGGGRQAVALVQYHDCFVCGIDTNAKTLQKAIQYAYENSIPGSSINFITNITNGIKGTFDIVISQSAMEHFPDPVSTLNDMKSLINRQGKILLTFAQPWFSPYGSHMHFFSKVPWLNLLFTEETVMKVRARYRNDGAARYCDVESGLNKMTIKKFERILSECGLRVEYKKYTGVKRLNFLTKIPLLRELFINRVTCILALPYDYAPQLNAE